MCGKCCKSQGLPPLRLGLSACLAGNSVTSERAHARPRSPLSNTVCVPILFSLSLFYNIWFFVSSTVDLLSLHLGRHLGVVLLEALAEALLGEHLLLDAAGDAAGLAGGEGL